nr:hypothetical protein [Tanacetum cinerariifolium]
MNEGPSVAKVPKDGLSVAKDTFFDSTDNDIVDNSIMDGYVSDVSDSPNLNSEGKCLPVGKKANHKFTKNKNAEGTSDLSYTPNYKGKYVPIGKKANQKVILKSLILVTCCVLGLANGKTWDEILKTIRNMKTGNCVDKGKRKAKV